MREASGAEHYGSPGWVVALQRSASGGSGAGCLTAFWRVRTIVNAKHSAISGHTEFDMGNVGLVSVKGNGPGLWAGEGQWLKGRNVSRVAVESSALPTYLPRGERQ